MKHLNEGQIRAALDQELPTRISLRQAQDHLEACPACKHRAEEAQQRLELARQRLSLLEPQTADPQPSAQAARRRAVNALQAHLAIEPKEKQPMWNKLFSRPARPVWATLAVIAILAAALSFPQVRAAAESFLGLFRVQQVRVVQINPGDLPENLGNSSQLEKMFAENVQMDETGEPQTAATATEASALAGIPVRLPQALDQPADLVVQPGGKVVFNVDLELVKAVLKDLQREDITLPDELDGAAVQIDIPAGVIASFGDCPEETLTSSNDPDDSGVVDGAAPDCTVLAQMLSPTITAPPGLDISRIGEAYLQLLGMTRLEAASFAASVDWTTTFVIPVPRYGAEYREVLADGSPATLITRYEDQYVLVWVKDGILYALSGWGDGDNALDIANSLQ